MNGKEAQMKACNELIARLSNAFFVRLTSRKDVEIDALHRTYEGLNC